jgi:PAS domain S-box-containing protein
MRKGAIRNLPRFMIAAFMALGLASAGLEAAPTTSRRIRAGIYQNSPKVFWERDGEPRGFFVEVLDQIALENGWEIDYVPGTWAENLESLDRGELDLVLDVTFTDDRAEHFDFNSVPVIESWLQAFTNREIKLGEVRDLDKRRIAVLKGSVQEEYLKKVIRPQFGIDFILLPCRDYAGTVKVLRQGRADLIIANRFFYFSDLRGQDIVPTALIFHPSPVYFGFPKGQGGAIMGAIDKGLSEMKNNSGSTYYRSLYRWLGERPRQFIPAYLKWALISLAGLVLLSGSFVMVLRHQVKLKTREIVRCNESNRQGLELLDAVFNVIPDVIGIQDAEHGVERYNLAGYQSLKCAHLQTNGGKCFRFLGRDRPCDECATAEAVKTGRPARVQRFIKELGIWADVRAYPILDGKGNVVKVVEHIRDITDIRAKEEELFRRNLELYQAIQRLEASERELQTAYDELKLQLARNAQSEERYRRLVDNAGDLIYLMKVPDGVYEYVSPAAQAVLGYPAEELYRRPMFIREIIHPDWKQYLEEKWRALLEGREEKSYEYQIIDPAGNARWLSQHNSYIRDQDGRLSGIEGIIRDITITKVSQDAMLLGKRMCDTIIDSAPLLIVGLGRRLEILMFNAWAEQVTGCRSAEVLGKGWLEDFIENASPLRQQWEEAVREKEESVIECGLRVKKGTAINIRWKVKVLEEDGEFFMALALGREALSEWG